MTPLRFDKYQGTGNDFIIVDDRSLTWGDFLTAQQIARLCDRRFGIGADGLMLLQPHERVDFRMRYFNADGNESTMCGNGGRCLVDFAHRHDIIREHTTFEAIDGLHDASWEATAVSLRMSNPTGFTAWSDQQSWINTGSPHLVVWENGPVSAVDVAREGAALRHDPRFSPGGTNVNFVELRGGSLLVRTFERGVEAETLSCGTGVTAAAYLHLMKENKLNGEVSIQTPGGQLLVRVQDMGSQQEKVWLIGPATFVFSGEITLQN